MIAVAEAEGRRHEDRVRVVWDRYSEPRYRFAIDDNSFFLRDIAGKNYKSLFDCFYLKLLRDLYRKYGAKFVLNIYYTAADDAKFPTAADFRLPQFPARYKGEWRDNALAEAGFSRPLEQARPTVSGYAAGKTHRRHEAGRRRNPPFCRRRDVHRNDLHPFRVIARRPSNRCTRTAFAC